MKTENIGALLREGVALREEIAVRKARLAEINLLVAQATEFRDGCNTGRIAADGVLAKVVRKTTVTWDQQALSEACKQIGVAEFRKGFAFEFRPRSARALQDWLASPETSPEARDMVCAARTIRDAAPTVTFERVEEEA